MLHSLIIDRLGADDVPAIVRLLETANAADRRYFTPFQYTFEAVDAAIKPMVKDGIYGVTQAVKHGSRDLLAFYMLRGLDEGYPAPMYGVFVAPTARRVGIASLTIRHAITLCKLNRFPSLMLKVFPENQAAVGAYVAMGFKPLRDEPPQRVMQLELERP